MGKLKRYRGRSTSGWTLERRINRKALPGLKKTLIPSEIFHTILVKNSFVFPASSVILFSSRSLILSFYLCNQFRHSNYSNEYRLSEDNEADLEFDTDHQQLH